MPTQSWGGKNCETNCIKYMATHGKVICHLSTNKYYPNYQMLSTSITKMNEKSTNQNPQNYHLALNKWWRLILFRASKSTVMGVCIHVH
jgi:hypothetical protein